MALRTQALLGVVLMVGCTGRIDTSLPLPDGTPGDDEPAETDLGTARARVPPGTGPAIAPGGRGPGLADVPAPLETAISATYYVAVDGDDENDGSIERPWRSLARANATLTAGEMVYVRAGSYDENIAPSQSGTPAARIYYRAYPGEVVTLNGSSAEESVVDIGADYITVRGFHIFQTRPSFAGYSGSYTHVTLWGSHAQILENRIVNHRDELEDYHAGTHEIGVAVLGRNNLVQSNEIGKLWLGVMLEGFDNVIRGNTIESNTLDGIRLATSYYEMQGNLIESNVIGGSHFSDGIQSNGDFDLPDISEDTSACGFVIRNNIIHDNSESGIDIKGSCRILIENNIIYGTVGDNDGAYRGSLTEPAFDRISPGSICIGTGSSSRDVIIRYNLAYDNNGGFYQLTNWMIYNNTIVGNNRDYTGPNSEFTTTYRPQFFGLVGRRVAGGRNNIIADHNHSENHGAASADWDSNIYWSSFQEPALTNSEEPFLPLTLSEWVAETGVDGSSRVIDPRFVHAPSRFTKDTPDLSFQLQPDSPAIDAGTWLTTTREAGSGTELPVANAHYFFEGNRMLSGDRIAVGDNPLVTITAVDYETHTLTVDTPITWTADAPINLPYEGAAPDIGAYESN